MLEAITNGTTKALRNVFDENKSKFTSTEMKNNDIGIVQIKTNSFVSLPIPYVNENKFDVIQ